MSACVLIQPSTHKDARGWRIVIVRLRSSLERLGEYVHSEPFNNRAAAGEEAELYAKGWKHDFERQHGAGFAELAFREVRN